MFGEMRANVQKKFPIPMSSIRFSKQNPKKDENNAVKLVTQSFIKDSSNENAVLSLIKIC